MAEITEKQVYEAFGLGEQVQEPADPAATPPTQQGEQVQEVADPAEEQEVPETGVQTEPAGAEASEDGAEEGSEGGNNVDKQPLTPQQRRENAARRREQEKQAAVSQAVQQERDRFTEQLKDIFARAGIRNTVTGEDITTMEQFEQWQQQFGEKKLQQDLQAGKLTPEALSAAISNHPVVKQAQQLITQDTEAKRAQEKADAKAKIEGEIAEIHKLDASINSLEDLVNAPYWPELYDMTKRGYSIKDAHFLLNHKRLEEAKLEAARQQGMNNARSKDHMTRTVTPKGPGAASVPADEMALFRQFNPGATDAEIQAYYNKHKNK